MFTISAFTSEDNPPPRSSARPPFDTWTMLTLPAPQRAGFRATVAFAVELTADYLAVIPRRVGSRLFAMNDTEAYWRGWQIVKLRAGLARRYRDPAFDRQAAVERLPRQSDCGGAS